MFSCNILPLVCLVTVFVGSTLGNRNHDCFVGRRYHRHNQMFSLPNQSHCIRYICWYGRVIRRIEACEVEDECHRVGSTFEHRCTRYRCNKIERGHLIYYQPDIVSTRCSDYYGQCRRPGEIFPFQMHGTYYPTCNCTTNHNSIRYRCTSYQLPRRVSGFRGSTGSGGSPNGGISGGPHPDAYGPAAEEDLEYSISVGSVTAEK